MVEEIILLSVVFQIVSIYINHLEESVTEIL